MTLIETVTLDKREIEDSSDRAKTFAIIRRSFADEKTPGKVVGELLQTVVCEDCYLETYYDGSTTPVVRNCRESIQTFHSYDRNGEPSFWGSVPWNKARRISERQTSLFGSLVNRVYHALQSL